MMPGNSQRQTEQRADRFYGKYRGTVTDNQDPKSLGRLKAKVPDLLGEVETGWAFPCGPYAGDGAGHFMVPPSDAGVWIEFEAGDVSRPIWTGCWWSEKGLPSDKSGAMAQPSLKIIKSEKGLMVAMDDAAETISVSDAHGTNLLEIKAQQGQLAVKAATLVVIEAPQIALGQGAAEPAVLGDQLRNYLEQVVNVLQSHIHPGQTAAGFPVTPAPPSPLPLSIPLLLSTKVKTG